jgi:hypothetical protein
VSGSKSAIARALPAALALQLSGVIQSGGKPEAIVVMGGESDSLRIGHQGSKETPLLPRGWSVESININACSLVLKQAGQLHTYNCANSCKQSRTKDCLTLLSFNAPTLRSFTFGGLSAFRIFLWSSRNFVSN